MDLKNIQYIYVATDIARQATTILDKGSATYIADGEMVVTDLAGNVLTTTAATYTKDKVKIVIRKGDTLISSPPIAYKNVKKYLVKAYAANAQQVTYIGYNGTTGNLEAGVLVPATDYIVRLRKRTIRGGMSDTYFDNKSVEWYNNIATVYQNTLADGLVANMIANFNADHQIDNFVIFERVCSSAATVLGGGRSIVVTNGSKTATISGAGHNVVVGDYLRLGGTAVTTPVYRVDAVSSQVITFDVPYQGVSGTIANANALELNTPGTPSNWGIKITGNTHTFEPDIWRHDEFKFDVTLTNFNSTIVTTTVEPYLGSGTYAQVAEMESYAFGNEALGFARLNMPPRTKTLKAVSGKTYDFIVINAFDNDYSNIHTRPESPFEIIIAMPVGCTQGDSAGSASVSMGIATALDIWLTTMTGQTYNEDSKLT